MLGLPRFLPCTPRDHGPAAGVWHLPAGKHCVVLGRSNIVGKPMALLLLAEDATVTVCHSRTPDLAEQCRRADILISAVGRRGHLHFTGDFHAIGAANNLLAAMLDNHIQQGNELGIDVKQITWKRCVDMNDRQLRHVIGGTASPGGRL